MRVLVTRPEADAAPLIAALAARGHAAMVEPMLRVEPLADARVDLAGVRAILFTSANGVRAFARLSGERALPVYAVGDASAAAARAAGFARVESAGGDGADLARLVAARLRPEDGALFHGAGKTVARDLKGALEGAGFQVRRVSLYEARPAEALSAPCRAALAEGALDAAAFFSPRTAETFVRLSATAGLSAACARVHAVCLSPAVAGALAKVTWRDVRVAARPDQRALLARIDELAGAPAQEEPMPQESTSETPGAEAGARDTHGPGSTHDVIARFGGIRPMAAKLGVAVSTVQGWRERGVIPRARHAHILAAATEHGIALAPEDLAGEDDKAAMTGDAETHPAPSDAPPSPEPPLIAAEPRARAGTRAAWLGGIVLGALVLGLGAGGAILVHDAWLPLVAAPAPVQSATADPRVAALSERVAALESAPSPTVPPPIDTEARAAARRALAKLDDLSARVDALAARAQGEVAAPEPDPRLDRIPSIEADIARLDEARTVLAARVDALDALADAPARLDALATKLSDLGARIDALGTARAAASKDAGADALRAVAILQLRDAILAGRPFESELETARALTPNDTGAGTSAWSAALDALAPHAAAGVPALAALRASFPAVARAILAAPTSAASGDWVAGALRRISALVTVRPAGPVEGTEPGAIVARAEARLADGDLAGAVAELDALDGPPAAAAKPWRAQAAARLDAERALGELGRGAVAARAPGRS